MSLGAAHPAGRPVPGALSARPPIPVPPQAAVPRVTPPAAGAASAGVEHRQRGQRPRSESAASAPSAPPQTRDDLWINESAAMLSLSQEATQYRLAATQARARVQASADLALPSSPEENEARSESTATLSDEEMALVRKLAARDREVRTHEEAHRATAGSLYRNGPNYEYVTGPDGRQYAVSGSVQIDTSPGRTPEETIRKAQQVQRSALAPVDPSGADRAVAAAAAAMEAQARRDRAASESSSNEGSPVTDGPPGATLDLTA